MASTNDVDVKAGFWYCKQSPESLGNSKATIYFTHLFCAYADISSSDYRVTIPIHYKRTFENFTPAAKERNSEIKTIISVGGVDSDPSTFASMAREEVHRREFIKSSIKLARELQFDGLHLSWQYPATPEDMRNLGDLLHQWREAVVEDAGEMNKLPLLLSATVFYTPKIMNGSVSATYPADAILNNLDWINVRAYDFYNPKSCPRMTKPPAALHNPTAPNPLKSVDTGISDWIDALPPTKLVLGLPFVGFTWSLQNSDEHEIFAPAAGPPESANSDGNIFYRNIKEFIADPKFTHEFKEDFVTDYCFAGHNWIGYDDTDSIKKKIQYFKEKKLRGYFAWHVSADDPDLTLSKTASTEWDHRNTPHSSCSIL